MIMFDRKILFDEIRKPLFEGALNSGQVAGIDKDLDYWEENYPDGNLQHLAYILATEYHETKRTMQPIPEGGGKERLRRMYDITGDRPDKARELGNVNPGDGATYTGGKVQLTGRSNFRKMGKRLNLPLEDKPELIYDIDVSTAVLFVGMLEGIFTTRSLEKYTDKQGVLDSFNARRVVNGTDRAAAIANIYKIFLQAVLMAKNSHAAEQVNQSPPQNTAIVNVTTSQGDILPTVYQLDQDSYLQYQEYLRDKTVKAVTAAASKPGWRSKIVNASLFGLATVVSMLAARYGFDVPAETVFDILSGLATGTFTATMLFRVFATNTTIRR